MAQEISLEKYKKAFREVMKEEGKKYFLAHLVVYVLVNALLIAINLIYSPENIWFIYPLIGWGGGLLMHYLFAVHWLEKRLKKREANAEYRARENKI